jgi:hypothetical protein
MIETEITILINRKSDIGVIKQNIIETNIQFPVYIIEYENHYKIDFVSDYEEWEFDTKILNFFSEYEFTSNLENGRKEIRLQLSRYQSELSTDGWGRRIENPLNEVKYLIKKSNIKPEKFNPKIKVLFGSNEQNYYINIVNGINKTTEEKGFLLLNDFKSNDENKEVEIIKDKLYKSPIEAFYSGCYKIQEIVNQDFKDYIQGQKKEIREKQKLPRKLIRDFINSCNKSEIEGILKNLDENIIFEKRIPLKTELLIEGIQEFETYIKSPNQELFAKNFKIRSSWSINLPHITIGVKFYPITNNHEEEIKNTLRYKQINFEINNNKIICIIEEQ